MGDIEDEKRAHEIKLAKIEARRHWAAHNPVMFTVWDVLTSTLNIVFWLAFWSLIAQCTCSGCVW